MNAVVRSDASLVINGGVKTGNKLVFEDEEEEEDEED